MHEFKSRTPFHNLFKLRIRPMTRIIHVRLITGGNKMETKDNKQTVEDNREEDKHSKEEFSVKAFYTENLMTIFLIFFGLFCTWYTYPSFTSKLCGLVTMIPICQMIYRSTISLISLLKPNKNREV